MALSNEDDPREAIRLILDDNATNSDYSEAGTKPGTIEVVESSPQNIKQRRSGDAIYIWRPADDDIAKFGASGSDKRETAVVQAEAWSKTGSTRADDLAEDIQSITGGYANDSKSNTAWVDVYPVGETDHRHETGSRTADHYVAAVQIRLDRIASI